MIFVVRLFDEDAVGSVPPRLYLFRQTKHAVRARQGQSYVYYSKPS